MKQVLLAGFFAACGSSFGKLSGEQYLRTVIHRYFQSVLFEQFIPLLQALFLILMIVCNVLNWRHFLKALQTSNQTLPTNVLSTASNYLFSFLFGMFLFGETFSTLSLIGIAMIVISLYFLLAEI